MLGKVILICCIVASGGPLTAQSTPQIEASSQPAVNTLSEIANTIKECPRVVQYEKQWGKSPQEVYRLYEGPPVNVTWDVAPRAPTSLVRSRYVGYIEFSLPGDFWVPEESLAKFMHDNAAVFAAMESAQKPWKYRYEFDVGPDGVEITKRLAHRVDQTEWSDVQPGKLCWDDAAQMNKNGVGQPSLTRADTSVTTPPQTASKNSSLAIWESGKTFERVCSAIDDSNPDHDEAGTIGLCIGFLEGVQIGISDAAVRLEHEGNSGADLLNVVAFCTSAGHILTGGERVRIVLKYIQEHHESADLPTSRLAVVALKEAFPCPSK